MPSARSSLPGGTCHGSKAGIRCHARRVCYPNVRLTRGTFFSVDEAGADRLGDPPEFLHDPEVAPLRHVDQRVPKTSARLKSLPGDVDVMPREEVVDLRQHPGDVLMDVGESVALGSRGG